VHLHDIPFKNVVLVLIVLTVCNFKSILIIKPLDALVSQIQFWNKALHVSDSSSVHDEEFFTIHTAMVYVIQANCQQTCMTYTMAVCTVKNS